MILVDEMGHMVSDTSLYELHRAAYLIGLDPEWFQEESRHPHYDLMGYKKRLALWNGAVLVNSRELVKRALKKGRDLPND